MEAKKKLGSQFAQVVYEGKWFTPLREAIQAFVESTQKYVTGEVKFKLYKGTSSKPVQLLHTACTTNLLHPLQQVICMITMMQTDSSPSLVFRSKFVL